MIVNALIFIHDNKTKRMKNGLFSYEDLFKLSKKGAFEKVNLKLYIEHFNLYLH